MKRSFIFILLVIGCFGLMIYGSGKYADVKAVIKQMADCLEKFIASLEKAENVDAVANALDDYTKATVKMAPKVREMMKKYPELKDGTLRPEELKPLLDKLDELAKKLAEVFGKVGQYANDPKVKAATKRLQKAMALLEKEEDEEEEK